jgi:multidrug transporter EmrE-like cation transporter
LKNSNNKIAPAKGVMQLRRVPMGWIFLAIASLFEIVWAVGLKQTEGFTKLWPSLITITAMWISFGCLS